jgi:hypothetical protein
MCSLLQLLRVEEAKEAAAATFLALYLATVVAEGHCWTKSYAKPFSFCSWSWERARLTWPNDRAGVHVGGPAAGPRRRDRWRRPGLGQFNASVWPRGFRTGLGASRVAAKGRLASDASLGYMEYIMEKLVRPLGVWTILADERAFERTLLDCNCFLRCQSYRLHSPNRSLTIVRLISSVMFVSAYRLYNLDYNLNYIIQIII